MQIEIMKRIIEKKRNSTTIRKGDLRSGVLGTLSKRPAHIFYEPSKLINATRSAQTKDRVLEVEDPVLMKTFLRKLYNEDFTRPLHGKPARCAAAGP